MARVAVVGGGLAGCEAALQLGDHGVEVTLFEMRPAKTSPAHSSDLLAELVCSNSLKSVDPSRASGLLKQELDLLGSRLLRIAREHAVAAGAALAVDRNGFASSVTDAVYRHSHITVLREEFVYSPNHGYDAVIVAAGPLASDDLIDSLGAVLGGHRSFYDAAAPIIDAESIDFDIAFFGSRYGKGNQDDYVNCPFTEKQYDRFIDALRSADRVIKRSFEEGDLFSACQPIEEIARTSREALRFGALKPVGLTVPSKGGNAYAVAQLRTENEHRQAYNLVGFQTNLTWPEQRRVFRLVPGLENAEFLRFGVMHRNTYIVAPQLLNPDFSVAGTDGLWFAGQITGTEGYCEAIATGLYAALNVHATLQGEEPIILPSTTVLGSLLRYTTTSDPRAYQPMHVNFGIIDPLDPPVRNKGQRYSAYARRSLADLRGFLNA